MKSKAPVTVMLMLAAANGTAVGAPQDVPLAFGFSKTEARAELTRFALKQKQRVGTG